VSFCTGIGASPVRTSAGLSLISPRSAVASVVSGLVHGVGLRGVVGRVLPLSLGVSRDEAETEMVRYLVSSRVFLKI